MSGQCLEVVLAVSVRCPESVRSVSRKCLDSVMRVDNSNFIHGRHIHIPPSYMPIKDMSYAVELSLSGYSSL